MNRKEMNTMNFEELIKSMNPDHFETLPGGFKDIVFWMAKGCRSEGLTKDEALETIRDATRNTPLKELLDSSRMVKLAISLSYPDNDDHDQNADELPKETITKYKGLTIHDIGGRYQVRWYQQDIGVWHAFRPWCDTMEEAKAVADKLIA